MNASQFLRPPPGTVGIPRIPRSWLIHRAGLSPRFHGTAWTAGIPLIPRMIGTPRVVDIPTPDPTRGLYRRVVEIPRTCQVTLTNRFPRIPSPRMAGIRRNLRMVWVAEIPCLQAPRVAEIPGIARPRVSRTRLAYTLAYFPAAALAFSLAVPMAASATGIDPRSPASQET